jgi:hypothetical protein
MQGETVEYSLGWFLENSWTHKSETGEVLFDDVKMTALTQIV